jgi:hypothetical protein
MFSVKNLEFALLLLANIGTILSLLPYAALEFSVEKVVDRAGTLHNVDTKKYRSWSKTGRSRTVVDFVMRHQSVFYLITVIGLTGQVLLALFKSN